MEKEAGSRKTKKTNQNLNPTALTKGNKMGEEAASPKNNKNPSKPKPDGLKQKTIKWRIKLQVEKQKKSMKA